MARIEFVVIFSVTALYFAIVPLTIVEQKFKFRIELHPCAFESGGDELCTVPNALNKFIRFGQ